MDAKIRYIQRTGILAFVFILLLVVSLFIQIPFQKIVIPLIALLLNATGFYFLMKVTNLEKRLQQTSQLLSRSTERDFTPVKEHENHIISHEISNLITQLEDSVKQSESLLKEKDDLEKEVARQKRKTKFMSETLNKHIIALQDRMRENNSSFSKAISDLSTLYGKWNREEELMNTMMNHNKRFRMQFINLEKSLKQTHLICFKETEKGQEAENFLNELYEKDELLTDRFQSIVYAINNIREVTDIINEVADKASILSLNAAIESAHAGEAGKGFAVVAEEVGSLADNTAEHAENINQALYSLTDLMNESRYRETDSDDTFSNLGNNLKEMIHSFKEIDELFISLDLPETPDELKQRSLQISQEGENVEKTIQNLKTLKEKWEDNLEEISHLSLIEEQRDFPPEEKAKKPSINETSVKPVLEEISTEEID